MADPQKKLVKVDDDVIAFPGQMPDEHVAIAIRNFRAQKKAKGLTTEASEHQRQLKPAQPLSTVVDPIVKAVSTPIPEYARRIDRAFNKSLGLPEIDPIQAQQMKAVAEFDKAHPVVGGIMQGTSNFAEGMLSPANIGLMLSAPQSKLLSAYFAIQAMNGSYKSAKQAEEEFKKGNNKEAAQYATESLLGLGVAGMAGHHAVKGTMVDPSALHEPSGPPTIEGIGKPVPYVPERLGPSGEAGIVPVEAAANVKKTPTKLAKPLTVPEVAALAEKVKGLKPPAPTAPQGWQGMNFRTATGDKPRPDDTPPQRTPDGDFVLYHGTSKAALPSIMKEGFKGDNLNMVGFGTTPGAVSVFALRSGGKAPGQGAYLRFVLDKDWVKNNALVTVEHGNKNLYLLSDPNPQTKWKQPFIVPPSAIKKVQDVTNDYLSGNMSTDRTPKHVQPTPAVPTQAVQAPAPVTPAAQAAPAQVAPKEAEQPTKYKFGNTQAAIPQDSEAGQSLTQAKQAIDPADLAGKGIENKPHITIRYGIDGEDTEGIKKYLESQAPFEATLGKTESFPVSEHSEGAAPIIAPINAPDLHRMEKELDEHGNFIERSFPEYAPHATIAYVRPEAAQKYVGNTATEGKKFTVNSVDISKKDGTTETVQLKGQPSVEPVEPQANLLKTGKGELMDRIANETPGMPSEESIYEVMNGLRELQEELAKARGAQQDLNEVWERIQKRKAAEKEAESSVVPIEPSANLTYKAVDQSQPFYLKSDRIIGEKMKGPMPAADLQKMLLANGVKQEEMKWTGLDEFLKEKGNEKVTPQEIQEFVKTHDLQVVESPHGFPSKTAQYDEEIRKLSNWPDDAKKARNPSDQPRLDELLKLWDDADVNDSKPTKYSNWVLPGGDEGSYRELLITLPPQVRGDGKIEFERDGDVHGYPRYRTETQNGLAFVYFDPISKSWASYSNKGTTFRDGFKTADEAKDELSSRLGKKPKYDETFQSKHWDEANPLGHIRFNDRTGPNGERILHLEELQSDWHQKGRQKGYQEVADPEHFAALRKEEDGIRQQLGDAITLVNRSLSKNDDLGFDSQSEARGAIVAHPDWADRWDVRDPADIRNIETWRQLRVRQNEIVNQLDTTKPGSVPDAPWKKTWHEQMLRRMVHYAAQNGYDGISWTPGAEQAERYDLSKKISRVKLYERMDLPEAAVLSPKKYRLTAYGLDGGIVNDDFYDNEGELENVIGKEATKKLLESSDDRFGVRELSGLDLKVGGEGMHGFYDKIIPDAANKIGKQWGAKVGEIEIPTGEGDAWKAWDKDGNSLVYRTQTADNTTASIYFPTEEAARKAAGEVKGTWSHTLAEKESSVPYLSITPEMRKGVTEQGFPLFNLMYKAPPAFEPTLAESYRKQGDAWTEIQRIGFRPPSDPSKVSEWERKISAARERFNAAKATVEDAEKGIGEVHDLQNGARVLFLRRAGLRALHIGFGGEVRPGSNLNGVSLTKDQLVDILGNLNHLKPAFAKELKQALLQAMDDKDGSVTVSTPREPWMSRREWLSILYEELFHTSERNYPLSNEQWMQLNAAIPDAFNDHLAYNYEMGDDGTLKRAKMRAKEAIAHFAAGRPEEYGMSQEEMASYLFQYYDALVKTHGPEALEKLKGLAIEARRVREEYKNATGIGRLQRDNRDNRSLSEGGQAGTSGTGEEAGRGVPQESTSGPRGDREGGSTEAPKPAVEPQANKNLSVDDIHAMNKKAAFDAWFGQSKVVNTDGSPMVVYHGTKADFSEFDPDSTPEEDEDIGSSMRQSGADPITFLGSHFAKETSVANKFAKGLYGNSRFSEHGGRVMPVYLKIDNPYKTTETEMRKMMMQGNYNSPSVEEILEEDGDIDETGEKYEQDDEYREDVNARALEEESHYVEPSDELAREMADDFLQTMDVWGHDGIEYHNEIEGGTSYVVFDPTQVKSAIGNKGTFDPTNPDITANLTRKESNLSTLMQEMLARSPESFRVKDPTGVVHFFPSEAHASRFREAAGIK